MRKRFRKARKLPPLKNGETPEVVTFGTFVIGGKFNCWRVIFKLLSKKELAQIRVVEEALEIYWNKNRAQHTLKYVTAYYSVFDFLHGLGNYFQTHSNFHKHGSKDIYTLLHAFAKEYYPGDEVLQQLISIDYYLQHKIKPIAILLPEIDGAAKQQLIDQHKLNHHRFRHVILPVSFNWQEFVEHNHILKDESLFVVEYDGTNHPRLVEGVQSISYKK